MAEHSLDDIIKLFLSGKVEEQEVKSYLRASGFQAIHIHSDGILRIQIRHYSGWIVRGYTNGIIEFSNAFSSLSISDFYVAILKDYLKNNNL